MRMIDPLAIPPPSSMRLDYPQPLETVIMRGLRRNCDERWSTALEIRDRLEQLAAGRDFPRSAPALATWLAGLFPDLRAQPTLSRTTVLESQDETSPARRPLAAPQQKARRRHRLRRLSVRVAVASALLMALGALGATLRASQGPRAPAPSALCQNAAAR